MKKNAGVTLLEMMLVIVIIGFVLTLSIRQYLMYSRENDIAEIKATVTQLFQSLSEYYQAQCRSSINLNNPLITIKTGTNALLVNGYLKTWAPSPSGLIDTTYGQDGFSVRFNGQTLNAARIPTSVFYNWTGSATVPITISFPQGAVSGTIYVWQIQIIMKLATQINAASYQRLLGATCNAAAPITTACANVATSGQYIVWESLPSVVPQTALGPAATTLLRIKSFTNLYYADDMYGAVSANGLTNNYMCGG